MIKVKEKIDIFHEYGLDNDQRTLFFSGDIDSPQVEMLSTNIHILNSPIIHPETHDLPINIVVHSRGGYDDLMLNLYDAITYSKAPIHTIVTGMVCSAATLLLVSGDKRFASENAYAMFHKGKVSLEGDEDEIIAGAEIHRKISDRYWKLLARHTKKSASWWFNKSKVEGELWLDSKQMQQYGVIDEILPRPRREFEPLSTKPVNKKKKLDTDDNDDNDENTDENEE